MGRLKRLDGLRGVLAVYVMLGHAMPFVALPSWCAAPFRHGEAAVDVFFALSGLVILNSLEHFGYRFWPFFKARARRLLPVYFFTLAFAVMLLQLASPVSAMPWAARSATAAQFWAADLPAHPLAHLLAHLFLIHGLLPYGLLPYAWITLLGPAWSLSTEWQFYVLIALIMPGLRLAIVVLALLAAGTIYHEAAPTLPAYWQFSRAFLPDAAPYFALGLASAIWLRGSGIGLFLVALGVSSALALQSAESAKALTPLAWALALAVQRHETFPILGKLLDSMAAQYLGAISYPLYLLNEPVQRGLAMVIAPLAHGRAGLFALLWLPLAVTAPILAAALVHGFIEKPFMRARPKGAPIAAPLKTESMPHG